MKGTLLVVLLLALAMAAMASSMDATPSAAGGNSVRWGKFRLHRLGAHHEEQQTEVSERKSELKLAKHWAKRVCHRHRLIRREVARRLHTSLKFWFSVVALRRAQVAFHKGRHEVHDKAHNYIKWGPNNVCKDPSSTACTTWKSTHPRATQRWHHARHEYHQGTYNPQRHAQKVRLNVARKRLTGAQAHVKRIQQKLRVHKKHAQKAAKRCHKRTHRQIAKITASLTRARARRHRITTQVAATRTQRSQREATYTPVYMTACKHMGKAGHYSGRHHVYHCTLNAQQADKAKIMFKRCKELPNQTGDVTKIKFHCWK